MTNSNDPAQLLALLRVLRAQGVTYFKSPEIEIKLDSQPVYTQVAPAEAAKAEWDLEAELSRIHRGE